MSTNVLVSPIYGWSWLGEHGETRETPRPFAVVGAPSREWSGSVLSEDHEFSAARARFSDRHTEPDGFVNVEITSPDSRRLAVGYARIEHATGS